MEALELFKESLEWLKNNYNNFYFFKERDIVWEIQKYLIKLIKEKELSYKILNDYPMVRHGKFSILCDLVIMEGEKVNIAIEFKYEPNHKREDISKCKFPVVSWNSVEKDIKRVKEFIERGKARIGYSIFIDEGGFFCKREAHPESQWEDWGKICVLISRCG